MGLLYQQNDQYRNSSQTVYSFLGKWFSMLKYCSQNYIHKQKYQKYKSNSYRIFNHVILINLYQIPLNKCYDTFNFCNKYLKHQFKYLNKQVKQHINAKYEITKNKGFFICINRQNSALFYYYIKLYVLNQCRNNSQYNIFFNIF